MTKTGFMQVVEMTDEEKFSMYMKLSKAEIVRMHIELEKTIHQMGITITNPPMVWPPIDNRPTFATTSSQSSLRPKYTLYLKRR